MNIDELCTPSDFTESPLNTTTRTMPDYTNKIRPNLHFNIRCDYRVILASQYISQRVCDLSGQNLEVGFVYGGITNTTHTDNVTKTLIDISELYMTTKQKITPVTFDTHEGCMDSARKAFHKKQKRIVGIGHSHAQMDVFHSPKDRANCETISFLYGIKVQTTSTTNNTSNMHPNTDSPLTQSLKYKGCIQNTIPKQQTSYILPSLVFNTKGDIEVSLACKESGTFTLFENLHAEYYNKKMELSQDQKKELDRKVFQILTYNNITPLADNAPQRNKTNPRKRIREYFTYARNIRNQLQSEKEKEKKEKELPTPV